MKKILLIAVIFFVTKLSALPVGNPKAASLFLSQSCVTVDTALPTLEALDLRAGYYGDFVFNRYFETVAGEHIDYSQIATNAGYVALSVWELLEIFTTLGVSRFSFNTSFKPFNPTNPSPRFDFRTSTCFSWSVGAHATLWQYRCFYLGLMAQYFSSKPRTGFWLLPNLSANQNNERSRYSEWQLGAGVAYRYSCYFVPYIAMKWSRALWELDQNLFGTSGGVPAGTLINLQSSKELGFVVGLSLAPFECENVAVTVEGRFGDEAALHVNGQLFF